MKENIWRDRMNKKLLTLITISFCVGGAAILTNITNNEVPVGTIKISNKVNGNYLAVEELTLWDKASRLYDSIVGGQRKGVKYDNAIYVIAGQKNLKSICWLPVPQLDKTTAFQYVCSGKYRNHYLDIQDNVTSDGYLRLIVREQLLSGFNWNVNSKEDGTFTYDNSRDRFKGYYIAIKSDGIAKVYFGDIGPNARWHQNIYLSEELASAPVKGAL